MHLTIFKAVITKYFMSEQGLYIMLKHNVIQCFIHSNFSFETNYWKKFAIGQM